MAKTEAVIHLCCNSTQVWQHLTFSRFSFYMRKLQAHKIRITAFEYVQHIYCELNYTAVCTHITCGYVYTCIKMWNNAEEEIFYIHSCREKVSWQREGRTQYLAQVSIQFPLSFSLSLYFALKTHNPPAQAHRRSSTSDSSWPSSFPCRHTPSAQTLAHRVRSWSCASVPLKTEPPPHHFKPLGNAMSTMIQNKPRDDNNWTLNWLLCVYMINNVQLQRSKKKNKEE